MKPTRFLLLLWLVLLSGCNDDPGTFSMYFTWDKPPAKTVWIWVRVEVREDPATAGTTLGSAGPEAYDYGKPLTMTIEGVSNGTDRVVVAEVRDGSNPNLPILYYGLSEPFELEVGKDTEVEVPLVMQVPESAKQPATVTLLFGGEVRDTVNLEELRNATIRTHSMGTVAITLANEPSFSAEAGLTTFDLASPDGISCTESTDDDGQIWQDCDIAGWDLSVGIDPSEKTDDQYGVFVKFMDRYGYESPVHKKTVTLDDAAPKANVGWLSSTVVRPAASAWLSVTFSEPIEVSQTAPSLAVAPDLPDGSTVTAQGLVGESTTFTWEVRVGSTAGMEGTAYGFHVIGTDLLGNKSEPLPVLDGDGAAVTLAIDGTSPTVKNLSEIDLGQLLFGKKDAGAHLGFDLVITDSHLREVESVGGSCAGICPVVRVGNKTLGVLDVLGLDLKEGEATFRYGYELKTADWGAVDKEAEVTVAWSDMAGNEMEAPLPQTVRFDFKAPGCLGKNLLPEFGNQNSKFVYTLTATELLSSPPELKVDADSEDLFSGGPIQSEDGYTYSWDQLAAGLPSQHFTVAAKLVDLAGNVSESEDDPEGYACAEEAKVDGEPPELSKEEIAVVWIEDQDGAEQTEALVAGDQDKVIVRFDVTEAGALQAGYPSVSLNVPGSPVYFERVKPEVVEPAAGAWSFEYVLLVDSQLHKKSEGLWPIRVELKDAADNQKMIDSLGAKLVKLDFTPPAAQCALIPDLKGAPYVINQTVTLQITPMENLYPQLIPLLFEELVPAAVDDPVPQGPLFGFESDSVYRFSHLVQDGDGEFKFTVRVEMTDLAGNKTPEGGTACSSGPVASPVDGLSPAAVVEDVSAEGEKGPVDPGQTPLRKGVTVAATVVVTGSMLEPAVVLGLGAMTAEPAEPSPADGGGWSWTLTRTLDGSEGEGWQPILLAVEDEAGNGYSGIGEEFAANLDFTAPTAVCKPAPEGAKFGDTLYLNISTTEPLSGGLPTVDCGPVEFVAPDPDLTATSYEYTHVVTEADESLSGWSCVVSLEDLAGNQTSDVKDCSGKGGAIDAEVPVILAAAVTTDEEVKDHQGKIVPAAGPADKVRAEFEVKEANGLFEPAYPKVTLEVAGQPQAMENVSSEAPEPGKKKFTFELEVDAIQHAGMDGSWPIRVQLVDKAGNYYSEDSLADTFVTIDMTPPTADCSLFPDLGSVPYGLGKKVVFQVSAMEELSTDLLPSLEVELMPEAGNAAGFFTYQDDTAYRYEHVVGTEDEESSFSVRAILTDLVGNATPEGGSACGKPMTGFVDAKVPSVDKDVSVTVLDGDEEVDFAVTPLRVGLEVHAVLKVANSTLQPDVRLGLGEMTALSEEPASLGDDQYEWEFVRILDGSEGEGIRFVTIEVWDLAGNTAAAAEYGPPLELDFTAPEAACEFVPQLAKMGDTLLVTVRSSEPLATGYPVLDSALGFTGPEEQGQPLTFTFSRLLGDPDKNLVSWTGKVNLKDLAGNTASPDKCSLSGALDGIPPKLSAGEVETDPIAENQDGKSVLAVGNIDKIQAAFNVAEAQEMAPGFPRVKLDVASGAIDFGPPQKSTPGNGVTHYEFLLEMDKAKHAGAEGFWPVRVELQDKAGNPEHTPMLAGQLVQVDFTPPSAHCSLIPDLGAIAHGAGKKVSFMVIPMEERPKDYTPELVEVITPDVAGDLPFFAYEPGTTYRYSRTILKADGEGTFELGIRLSDVVGNQTPDGESACVNKLVKGQFDGLAPSVKKVVLKVDGGAVDPNVTPLRAGRSVSTTIQVVNSDLLPEVQVGLGAMKTGMAMPNSLGNDTFEWVFERTLDGSEGEGPRLVTLKVADEAGNWTSHQETNQPLQFDFTAPVPVCNPPWQSSKLGDRLAFTVQVSEKIGELPKLTSILSNLAFQPPVFVADAVAFEFWHDIGPEDSAVTEWKVKVEVTDVAGNKTLAPCTASGVIDANPPALSNGKVSTNPVVQNSSNATVLAVGHGDHILAEFTVADSQPPAEGYPNVELNVAGKPIGFGDPVSVTGGNGAWVYKFDLEMDQAAHKGADGAWPVRVETKDGAGNVKTTEQLAGALVQVDFTPPTATCGFVPDPGSKPYGAGTTIMLQIAPSEELAKGKLPVLTETLKPAAALPFLAYVPGTTYHFSRVVGQADGERKLAVKAAIEDLVGNLAANLPCQPQEVDIDAVAPVLANGSVTTNPIVTNAKNETLRAVGNEDHVVASFDVTEENGVAQAYPKVTLNVAGNPIDFGNPVSVTGDKGQFHYVFDLKMSATLHQGSDGYWPVAVQVKDTAGNSDSTELLGGGLVQVDFTAPDATCAFQPPADGVPYGIGKTVQLQISPTEELKKEDPPGKAYVPFVKETLVPDWVGTFFTYDQGTKYRFSHLVKEGDGERDLSATVRLKDLVDNETPLGSNACQGQGPTGKIDGTRPTVLSVTLLVEGGTIDPKTTPLRKDLTVRATVVVTNTAIQPAVTLGAGAMKMLSGPAGGGPYAWVFERKLDGTEGEGIQKITVSGADSAGNTYSYTEQANSMILDFTPPAPDCSVLPAGTAKLNDSIWVTVQSSEKLLTGLPEFTSSLSFTAPQPNPLATKFQFQHIVKAADAAVKEWTYKAVLTDRAGNKSQELDCSGKGFLDAVAPAATNGTIITIPEVKNDSNEIVVAVGSDDKVRVFFTAQDAQGLSDSTPDVYVDSMPVSIPLSQLSRTTNPDGSVVWVFEATVTAGAYPLAEGNWPVRATVSDVAGNSTTIAKVGGKLLTIDFTPPQASCSLTPSDSSTTPIGIGKEAILVVQPLEDLMPKTVPTVHQSLVPPPTPPTFLVYENKSEYRFRHTVVENEGDFEFTLRVGMTDLVGNATPQDGDACLSALPKGNVDSKRPTVSSVSLTLDGLPLLPTTAVRKGRTIRGAFTVTGTKTTPAATLGQGAMKAVSGPTGPEQGPWAWVFERTLDASEGEGTQKVTVSGSDPAGNAYTYTEAVNTAKLDFTDPTAQCIVNLPVAKAGDEVTLTVILSEKIGTDPQISSPLLPFVLKSKSPNASSPTYIYAYTVGSDPITDWTATATAQDLAGNPNPAKVLCTGIGQVDGTPISILAGWTVKAEYQDPDNPGVWLATALRAKKDSRVTIEFTASEVPAGLPEVKVGSTKITSFTQAGAKFTFVHQFALNQPSGSEVYPVTAKVADAAGNETLKTLELITFDFDKPAMIGTASVQRCDGFEDAVAAVDEIYVKNGALSGDDCPYRVHKADCSVDTDQNKQYQVEAAFALSEPVQESLTKLTVDGKALVVDPCLTTESYVLALYKTAGTETTGAWLPVSAQLTDLAGNAATVTVGKVFFDFTAPTSPDTATDGRILYWRVPWGRPSWLGAPSQQYTVQGMAGAVEGGTRVLLYDGRNITGSGAASEIGDALAKVDGSFGSQLDFTGILLSGADRARVYVVARDLAGNVSDVDPALEQTQAQLVRNVAWVASMGKKKVGSLLENPLTFLEVPWFQWRLEQEDGAEAGANTGIAGQDEGIVLETTGADISWRKLAPLSDYPPQRTYTAMEYDAGRGVTVLFGGLDQMDVFQEGTWEMSSREWTKIVPTDPEEDGNPLPVAFSALAYDPLSERTILYGGRQGPLITAVYPQELWAWDGKSWEVLSADGTGPGARTGHALAYDTNRSRLVFFGGLDGASAFKGDTWEWNGTAWAKITPTDPEGDGNPTARYGHAMAYDKSRKKVVMWGGNQSSGTDQDVWEWNGTSWDRVVATDPENDLNPVLARYGRMTYDSVGKGILLYGGTKVSVGGQDSSVWQWNGISWAKLPTTDLEGDGNPLARYAHGMAYDVRRDKVVIFGGSTDMGLCDDWFSMECYAVWEWDGASWDRVGPDDPTGREVKNPSARLRHSIVFDQARKTSVTYGGYASSGYLSTTSKWDGATWTDPATLSDPEFDDNPTFGREGHALTGVGAGFGVNGTETFMFGGTGVAAYLQDSWFYDGTSWDLVDFVNTTKPSVRAYCAAAYHSFGTAGVILFGGDNLGSTCLNDTYRLTYSTTPNKYQWTKLSPASSPSTRSHFPMVYDPDRKRTVLFGGRAACQSNKIPLADTWEWTGTVWSPITPTDPEGDGDPWRRTEAAMAYDKNRQKVIMYGGADIVEASSYLSPKGDIWEFNGTSWHELVTADPDGDGDPTDRYGHAMTYSTVDTALVMNGGNENGDETWHGYSAFHAAKPGHVFSIPFDTAGHCTSPTFKSIAVEWKGTGFGTASGMKVHVWDEGDWLAVSSKCDLNGVAPTCTWTTTDATQLARLFHGDRKTLSLAGLLIGSGEIAAGIVRTDYVEAIIKYRLPPEEATDCD